MKDPWVDCMRPECVDRFQHLRVECTVPIIKAEVARLVGEALQRWADLIVAGAAMPTAAQARNAILGTTPEREPYRSAYPAPKRIDAVLLGGSHDGKVIRIGAGISAIVMPGQGARDERYTLESDTGEGLTTWRHVEPAAPLPDLLGGVPVPHIMNAANAMAAIGRHGLADLIRHAVINAPLPRR